MKQVVNGLSMVLIICVLVGCQTPAKYLRVDGAMLGTNMHITADLRSVSSQELYAAAMELDSIAKSSMSIFDPNSLLSRLNDNRTDIVDEHIAFNLALADSIGALSGGRYDVTVKPLVEAWGFAAKHRVANPNLDSILRFVGREKVRIVNGRLIKSDVRVQIDFNSIAKGYTVDLLAALVERLGSKNYLVDIGGEVRCRGVNEQGNPWRVGIESPVDGNMSDGDMLQRRLQISAGGLATSGNYRRFYLDDNGQKVAHTLDPRTGRSVLSRLLSVSVVAPTCAQADALGTMFLAMGADDAIATAKAMPHIQVYFILAGEGDEFEEYISPSMEELIIK